MAAEKLLRLSGTSSTSSAAGTMRLKRLIKPPALPVVLDYDIAISKLVKIVEMKNAGNTLQEISCKVSLNEEIIKKLISSISF